MKKKVIGIIMLVALLFTNLLPMNSNFFGVNLQNNVKAATYYQWNSSTIYNGGEVVAYGGKLWKAGWYTVGDIPGTTGQYGVWQEFNDPTGTIIEATPTPIVSGYPVWDSNTIYNAGDITYYNGKIWKAGWYTVGETPGTTGQYGVWQEWNATSTVAPTVAPTAIPTAIPTVAPTVVPTVIPTVAPTVVPTVKPTATPIPAQTTFTNPYIWADVPDQDIIRVGNVFYMSSTTMHMNPGVPIMKSTDLVNWEIVNYVYDTIASNDEQTLNNGKNEYGHGSWASSLRYVNGNFYCSFPCYTTGKTYIYKTSDIENGTWARIASLSGVYHDCSLLFDNGRVFLVYGSGDIKVTELTSDATAIKAGGLNKTLITNAGSIAGSGGLAAEGTHIQKINGKYYIFLICWPSGSMRTELCYRADSIDGTYTGRVALRDSGIAQGGVVDTANGAWYAFLFQDHGSVGRIPYLVPVTWSDGWPVFGINGKVPLTMNTPVAGQTVKSIVASDEFQYSDKLALVWQWNHNPDNTHWSLNSRSGFLRLTTGKISTSILDARNTLTQRTFGPTCSGNIAIETSGMKDGDYAGLAAFQKNYGFVGVKMSGNTKYIVMVNGSSGSAVEVASVPVTQNRIYFKLNCNFTNNTDKATFYYSLDGNNWNLIGNTLQMSYTLPHFMGYRFALFNYATKSVGGYVDFDYYRISK